MSLDRTLSAIDFALTQIKVELYDLHAAGDLTMHETAPIVEQLEELRRSVLDLQQQKPVRRPKNDAL